MAKLADIMADYERRMMYVARETCNEQSTETAARTPVDTGLLRSSWTPALNRIDGSNSGGDPGAVTTVMQAGDTYTYANNQPYAPRIEYEAWSMQAPYGMMWITVAKFTATATKYANRVKHGV